MARYPLPGTAVPGAVAFSPDDRLVTWLHSPEGTLDRRLFALDVATGQVRPLARPPGGGAPEEHRTREEKRRRERQRERGVGVTRYHWARDAPRLLVPLPGGVHVLDPPGYDALRLVVPGPVLDPTLSPDGRWVAYVRDAEVWVAPADGDGEPRQLTTGAAGTGRTHGLAEFVAQEEMDRPAGYWWSRDSTMVAFTEVDETHIPVYRIVHQGSDQVGEGAQEDHRYPFAGEANARVRLAVVGIDGGDPVWMDLGGDEDAYLARVDWLPGAGLVAQVENRAQTRLDLVRLDPATGAAQVLLTETSDVWINLHDLFRPLDGGGFLWASERTGFRHLELRDAGGGLVRVLTGGDWLVESVVGVREGPDGAVWFTGTRDGPTERHLYRVPLAGGEPERLTPEPGVHVVIGDHGQRWFVDVHGSAARPFTATLRSLEDGSVLHAVHDRPDPRVAALALDPPELTTVQTRDGVTLHAAVYRPEGDGPFPTVLSVYGGPAVQRILDNWAVTVSMRAQYLRSLGFLVVAADNRGGSGRGQAFEAAVRWDLGRLEVQDQVDVVRHFVALGLADPGRVGIYGWSYGGYLSAMALARAPETFHAAVAGALVTAWDGYDTHYTERYMGTPAANPEGYRESSVMEHAGRITGRLLLVHGLIDENVHFRHTARLLNRLVAERVPAELLLFPDERHVPRREADRVYMEERIAAFLLDALGPAGPG